MATIRNIQKKKVNENAQHNVTASIKVEFGTSNGKVSEEKTAKGCSSLLLRPKKLFIITQTEIFSHRPFNGFVMVTRK